MKRPQKGSTTKQYAYAVRKLNGQGRSKKENALLSGFSPSVSNNVANKIEKTEGYLNAVTVLAAESNNLVLAVMAEFKARGLEDFSNKDLVGAMNAISAAWDRFDKRRAPNKNETPEGNPLRKVFMQRVENQTIINTTNPKDPATAPINPIREAEVSLEKEADLDF